MRISRKGNLGLACGAAVVLSLVACKKQQGNTTSSQGGAVGGSAAAALDTSGGAVKETPTSNKNPDVTSTEVTHKFAGNVQEANRGRVLFITHNCDGCHGGLAGGAMGPSLRDTVWKFGGTDQAIHATIRDGRPAGMPAWGQASVVGQQNTLNSAQIDTIITYIRSMRTDAEPTFFFWNEHQQGTQQGNGTKGSGASGMP